MKKVSVVGGPLDGHEVSPGAKYVELEVRVIKRPATGLEDTDAPVYELTDGAYVFAGDRVGLCSGCGTVVKKAEGGRESIDCPLCGEPAKGAHA